MNQTPQDKLLFRQTAQSLIEVIIGVTIAGVFILSAGNLINVTTTSGFKNKQLQIASFLAEELMENVSVYADAKWYCAPASCAATRGLYNLNKGSSRRYFLTANNPFQWQEDLVSLPNGEVVNNSGQNYNRYFYVENVCRDAGGVITGVTNSSTCLAGSQEDSSTQKVTVIIPSLFQLERFMTRTRNAAVVQTDWSGGKGQTSFFADPIKYADDDGNITFSDAGSLKVKGY